MTCCLVDCNPTHLGTDEERAKEASHHGPAEAMDSIGKEKRSGNHVEDGCQNIPRDLLRRTPDHAQVNSEPPRTRYFDEEICKGGIQCQSGNTGDRSSGIVN